MWRLFSLLVFIVLVIAVVGYFRGWLHLGMEQAQDQTHINVTIDKQKAKQDAHKAEQDIKRRIHKIQGDIRTDPQPTTPQE